jgi:flagellar biosynthetic protein FlhB
MSEQPSGEKTFAPTQKRKDDAAKEGNVLRSKEVATAVSVLMGAVWLKLAGPWLLSALEENAAAALAFDHDTIADFRPGQMLRDTLLDIVPVLLTLGLLVVAATMAAQLLLGEGRWVAGNLVPKPNKLNPLTGLQRMFGVQGLIELGKSLAKLALLGAIAWYWGRDNLLWVLSLAGAN